MSAREDYLQRLLKDETGMQRKARELAVQLGRPGLPVSAHEGRLIQWLVASTQARRVVEIGGFCGYSASWILEAMPKDGTFLSLERDPQYAGVLREVLGEDHRAKVLEGDALVEIQSLEGEFDVVFIDANKSQYLEYAKWAIPRLVVGGLIIADNTFLFGSVYGEPQRESISTKQQTVMAEFNEFLLKHNQLDGVIFPTGEGLTVARKILA